MAAGREEVWDVYVRNHVENPGAGAKDMQRTAKSADDLDHKLSEVGKDAETLDDRLKAFYAHRRSLAERLQTEDDANLKREFSRTNQRIGFLEKIQRALKPKPGDASKGILDFGGEGIKPRNALIGFAAAGIAALAPAIGAAISGVLSGGVVGVAMAGGILAASHDPRVKAAASSFGDTISNEFFGAGSSFVQPVIDSLGILAKHFQNLHLTNVFAKVAPYVTTVADGIGRLVENLMPGLNRLLDRAGPFANAFAQGLSETGVALGTFLDDISSSHGALEGLVATMATINGLIILTGKGLNILSDTFDFVVQANIKWTDFLKKIPLPIFNEYVGIANKSLRGIADSSALAGGAMAIVATGALDVASAAQKLAIEVGAATTAIDALFKVGMDVDQANLRVQQSMLGLKQSLIENGNHWETNTQKGVANRQALLAYVAALQQQRDADITAANGNKEAIDKINANYDKAIDKLGKMVGKTKGAQDAFKDLAGEYHIDLIVSAFIKSTVGKAAEAAGAALAKLLGGARASGGPVIAGVPYRINERGSETVTFPANGTVHPANLSPAGGAMELRVVGGQSSFERFMAQFIKQYVRLYGGGNVQKAFGG